MVYAKRVWFSNGVHHHYSTKKMIPEITPEYFKTLVNNSPGKLPLVKGETKEQFLSAITPIIFDPAIGAKRVNLDGGVDVVKESANNFYEGVTQSEVEAFYKAQAIPNDPKPVLYGLNSKVVKENGRLVEKVYKVGGMYSQAIERIVYWLDTLSWPLWLTCLVIFVIGWIGQFIGHAIEGKRPSFMKDIQFLLIGPLWLLGHLYRKLGIAY